MYLNYRTLYYSAIVNEDGKDGNYITSMGTHACFSNDFRYLDGHSKDIKKTHYHIIMVRDPEPITKHSWNNYTLLTKRQLLNHIRSAQFVVGPGIMKFSIKEENEQKLPELKKKYPCFVIDLIIDSPKPIIHKYILTWVRYAYEYPFAGFLKDAIRFRATLQNLISPEAAIVICSDAGCYFGFSLNCHWNGGHSLSEYGRGNIPIGRKEIRKKLEECKCCNGLYYNLNRVKRPSFAVADECVINLKSPECFITDEDYKVREVKYLKYYNFLIDNKIKIG